MKNPLRKIAVAACTISLGFFSVSPANAAPGDWSPGNDGYMARLPAAQDGSFVRWFVTDYAGTMGHVMRFLPDQNFDEADSGTWYNGTEVFERTACTGQNFTLNGQQFVNNNDFDLVTDSDSDIVITGTGVWDVLDDSVETRVYSEGDLMRTTHILTNNTGSDVTFELIVDHDVSDSVSSGTTTDGDAELELSDSHFSSWDASYPSMVYSFFWGAPGIFDTASTALVDYDSSNPTTFVNLTFEGTQTFEQVTIPSGASYQLVWFNSNKEYANGSSGATAAAVEASEEFAGAGWSLTGRLARGLDVDMAGNWTIGSEESGGEEPGGEEAPALAETGAASNLATLGLVGFGAIIAGAALVRRRRA